MFPDDAGVVNRSVGEVGGEVLVEAFGNALPGLGATVATGRFGTEMAVEPTNDGSVTILVEISGSEG